MDLTALFQVSCNGILTGMIYGQMALALSIIYGVTRIINFAHGDMIVGAMLLLCLISNTYIDSLYFNFALTLILSVLAVWGMQKTVFNLLRGKRDGVQFITMAAVSIILLNALLLIFGADTFTLSAPITLESLEIFSIHLNYGKFVGALTALLTTAALFLFLKKTYIGKAIQAVSINPKGAFLIGLNQQKIFSITSIISGILIAVSALCLSFVVDVSVQSAPDITLLCFIIVIMGGLGSVPGTLLAGLIIGISESYVGYYISPLYKTLSGFVLLIALLLVRPQGLKGIKTV
ncbi:MAG: hypothetical protein COY39_03095 [Alphaproteobacteria bacterium CG_4_10_14_0_8_um_filter_37_21]|nr:MAG: hypothetical protein COY39_03095 [Alphaproteobacteria bacterium CG_4_10_14_0_8_um_filter_37_21]